MFTNTLKLTKRLETRLSSIELNKQIVFLWHFDKRHSTLNHYNFLFAKYLLDTQSYHIDGQRVVHEGIFFLPPNALIFVLKMKCALHFNNLR